MKQQLHLSGTYTPEVQTLLLVFSSVVELLLEHGDKEQDSVSVQGVLVVKTSGRI